MSVKHIGTTAAALTLGLALIASTPAGAVPLGTVAAEIDAAIDSSVIQVAKKGGPGGPGFRAQPSPGFRVQRNPGFRVQRNPGFRIQRNTGFRAQQNLGFRGQRLGRVAHIRQGFFRSGRRIWIYPAIGAGLIGVTLGAGWYWGDYYDDCLRWIIPCPGCAPALVDLCEPY